MNRVAILAQRGNITGTENVDFLKGPHNKLKNGKCKKLKNSVAILAQAVAKLAQAAAKLAQEGHEHCTSGTPKETAEGDRETKGSQRKSRETKGSHQVENRRISETTPTLGDKGHQKHTKLTPD